MGGIALVISISAAFYVTLFVVTGYDRGPEKLWTKLRPSVLPILLNTDRFFDHDRLKTHDHGSVQYDVEP